MAKNQEEKVLSADTAEVVSKEEYDKLKAELEALKSSKAEVKEDETLKDSKRLMKEKAKVRMYRENKSDDEVFVCVNGKALRIKRGIEVEIPKAYALVLERSENQKMHALNYSAEIAENSEI